MIMDDYSAADVAANFKLSKDSSRTHVGLVTTQVPVEGDDYDRKDTS